VGEAGITTIAVLEGEQCITSIGMLDEE
jgi:hypothetical protein